MSAPRHLLLISLVLLGACLLACGSSTPKPWSKREGQDVVVGSGPVELHETHRNDEQGAQLNSDGVGSATGSGMQSPQVQRVGPEVPDNLPPVDSRYDQVCATAHIETCPDGTTWKDERQEYHREYCALPNNVRHGPYIGLHSNNRIKECGPYVGGIRQGYWSEWDRDGNVAGTWKWENGAPTSGVVPK